MQMQRNLAAVAIQRVHRGNVGRREAHAPRVEVSQDITERPRSVRRSSSWGPQERVSFVVDLETEPDVLSPLSFSDERRGERYFLLDNENDPFDTRVQNVPIERLVSFWICLTIPLLSYPFGSV